MSRYAEIQITSVATARVEITEEMERMYKACDNGMIIDCGECICSLIDCNSGCECIMDHIVQE